MRNAEKEKARKLEGEMVRWINCRFWISDGGLEGQRAEGIAEFEMIYIHNFRQFRQFSSF